MKNIFKNKIVLVTGGSSGIGEKTALLFAKSGADVTITYKNNKVGAEKVVSEINKFGRKAIFVKADLINEKQAKKVIDEVIKKFGKIDILVNNAGRYIDGDEWNGSSKIWLKSLEQNLISMLNISKYTIEIFKK